MGVSLRAFVDASSEFLLIKASPRNRHELSDCQSPFHLLTQPPDSSEGKVGCHDNRLLGLWVSEIIHCGMDIPQLTSLQHRRCFHLQSLLLERQHWQPRSKL